MRFFKGNINEDLSFEYGDGTEAYQGCGVTFQNEFWYFGGNSHKRQVNCFNLRMTHNFMF